MNHLPTLIQRKPYRKTFRKAEGRAASSAHLVSCTTWIPTETYDEIVELAKARNASISATISHLAETGLSFLMGIK